SGYHQKDEKPIKKQQNRTRDGKVCEDEAKSNFIKSMLAIPFHSQSISMAEIVSKEAQMKLKAGICLDSPHTTSTLCFCSSKEAQAAKKT
ncbi:hypothetical protein Tco_0475772, partial [Tanacetum coccineum]